MIYIVSFLASSLFCYLGEIKLNRNSKHTFWYFAIAVLVVSVLAGIRDFSIGTDIGAYGHWSFIGALNSKNLINYIRSNNGIEYLYSTFVFVVTRFFTNEHWLYFFTGLLMYGVYMVSAVRMHKYCSITITWLMYLFLMYGDSLNAMRQMIAMSFMALSFSYAYQGKIKEYIIFTFVAASFHITALIGVLILFIFKFCEKGKYRTKAFFIFVSATVAVFFHKPIIRTLVELGILKSKFLKYAVTTGSSFSLNPILIRLPYLLLVLIYRKRFVKNKYEEKTNHFWDVIILLMIIELLIAETRNVNVTLVRIAYFFTIFRCFAIGRLINVSTRKNRQILEVVLLLLLVVTFVYQAIIQGNNEIYPFVSDVIKFL